MLQYNHRDLSSLIKLENNLNEISRNSWTDKLNLLFDESSNFDTCIIDSNKKKLIVFHRLLTDSCSRMTPSMQLLKHWLLGEKMSNESQHWGVSLSQSDVNLFFNGTKDELIQSYNNNHSGNSSNNGFEPTLDWSVLHFPANYILEDSEIKKIKTNYLKNDNDDYEVRINYGIVSKSSHLKSDKQKILDITKEFLAKKNFDLSKQVEAKDIDRNGEPIILWISKVKFKDSEFHPMIGVNFGYDNGLSGYRLGFGIFFKEENTGFYNFSKNAFTIFDKNINLDSIFKSWIHHKTYGNIEEVFEKFLNEGYEYLFNSIKRMIDYSKNFKYRSNESSRRILLSYHSTQFKKHKEKLSELHTKFSQKHGYTHFTHFLCWSYLAENVLEGDEVTQLANLIARNILILKR